MSNELLQKVIDTSNLGTTPANNLSGDGYTNSGTGLLYPDQANRFLDYMWDATILAKSARTIRMRSNVTEIDRVAVGQRIMTVATEDQPSSYAVAGNINTQGALFSKISLTTRKLRLDWELSAESLEDSIEGPDLEDHIARLMATQAGNDIEDVLINGNASTGTGLYSAFNGFRQLAISNAHVVDANAAGLDRTVFNNAIKAMPRKYKQRRNQLRFFAGSNLVQDYLYNLTAMSATGAQGFSPFDIASPIIRGDVAANDGGPGTVTPFAFGIPVINVPLMREDITSLNGSPTTTVTSTGALYGDVHLTFPQNFIIGIKRDVVVYRLFQPKKDTIEYTLFIRVGCAIENYDAHVIVKNVLVAGTAPNFGTSLSVSNASSITGGTNPTSYTTTF